jgi:hypothetical protein
MSSDRNEITIQVRFPSIKKGDLVRFRTDDRWFGLVIEEGRETARGEVRIGTRVLWIILGSDGNSCSYLSQDRKYYPDLNSVVSSIIVE